MLTPDGTRPAVAGTLWRSRTVEGDLGMRWSATGVVEAAVAERLLPAAGALAAVGDGLAAADDLAAAAAARVADPGLVAVDDAEERIATLAATLALRRHGRGRDLRDVRLVIGSGGVLRHAPADLHAGGWPLPRAATAVVDREYVLAAAGLLAAEHPAAAVGLLRQRLPTVPSISH